MITPVEGVFVYGTLMTGFENHKHIFRAKSTRVRPAKARGLLYHLAEGYPAMVPGEGTVIGEYIVPGDLYQVLPVLDRLEGYRGPGGNNLYDRVIQEVELLDTGERVRAYLYVYSSDRRAQLKKESLLIEHGDWRRFLREENLKASG
ncbi:gamma-glutamylcyclotransferase family protein [Calderihabitans maritimus]|uniref:Gamma-glutamylcyclotransferase AIG2-like domain-containing protein n=1 Tax=Calderihabitans maritimus TaxID=1246530 RepID=A0A1Z5HSV1_9FIRM|nr:gamma-glutamylcyclotransferase family protein [Calderihabitans maritimus]GAW92612.1 hypothetical protein KKC1_17630 [Calderihabitans maritimus]